MGSTIGGRLAERAIEMQCSLYRSNRQAFIERLPIAMVKRGIGWIPAKPGPFDFLGSFRSESGNTPIGIEVKHTNEQAKALDITKSTGGSSGIAIHQLESLAEFADYGCAMILWHNGARWGRIMNGRICCALTRYRTGDRGTKRIQWDVFDDLGDCDFLRDISALPCVET